MSERSPGQHRYGNGATVSQWFILPRERSEPIALMDSAGGQRITKQDSATTTIAAFKPGRSLSALSDETLRGKNRSLQAPSLHGARTPGSELEPLRIPCGL